MLFRHINRNQRRYVDCPVCEGRASQIDRFTRLEAYESSIVDLLYVEEPRAATDLEMDES